MFPFPLLRYFDQGLQSCLEASGHFIIMETEMKIGAVKRVCNYSLFITPHERLKKQPLFRTLIVGLTTDFWQTASNDYSPLLEMSGNVFPYLYPHHIANDVNTLTNQ